MLKYSLDQKCLSSSILYQANITDKTRIQKLKFTTVFVKQHLKLWYTNHKKLLSHRNSKSDTVLSNNFWKQQQQQQQNIASTQALREILGRHRAYNRSSKRSSLSLNEKMKIALYKNNNMLKKQTKILSNCRHKNRMIAETRSEFSFKFSMECFAQNYCVLKSGWLLSLSSLEY